jgi:hypothetical protein
MHIPDGVTSVKPFGLCQLTHEARAHPWATKANWITLRFKLALGIFVAIFFPTNDSIFGSGSDKVQEAAPRAKHCSNVNEGVME